jgi:hypothetical protein
MDFYPIIKTIYMQKKATRGRSQDRRKVAAGQEYEVNYESEKTGSSPKQVKRAVKSAGNSRKSVERKLSKKGSK